MTEPALWRRLVAEFLGSAFLAAVVIGSGIAAQQLSPGNPGLELFENAAATAAGLYTIILMFGPVSGGHFNPVVSLVDALFGGVGWRSAVAYIPVQVAGCVAGAVIANLMFSKAAVSLSTHDRASPAHFLSEIVATVGLILVIFSLARSGRSRSAPAAVGAYIGAAYFFTSSTSFANPAITVGRMFSNTFAGIAPASVPSFIFFYFFIASSSPRSWGAPSPLSSSRCCIPISPPPRPPTSWCRTTWRCPPHRRTTHDRQADRALPVRPQRRPEPGRTCAPRSLRAGPGRGRIGRFRAGTRPQPLDRLGSSPNAGWIPPENSPRRSPTTPSGRLMSW